MGKHPSTTPVSVVSVEKKGDGKLSIVAMILAPEVYESLTSSVEGHQTISMERK